MANKRNGTLAALYVEGTKVANMTSNDFSVEMSTRDATTKDSSGNEEVLEGLKSFTFNGEGYFQEDASYGYAELFTAWNARTVLTIRLTDDVVGNTYYEGECYITSLSQNNPLEETSTFSVSLKGTGALTISTVST